MMAMKMLMINDHESDDGYGNYDHDDHDGKDG